MFDEGVLLIYHMHTHVWNKLLSNLWSLQLAVPTRIEKDVHDLISKEQENAHMKNSNG